LHAFASRCRAPHRADFISPDEFKNGHSRLVKKRQNSFDNKTPHMVYFPKQAKKGCSMNQ